MKPFVLASYLFTPKFRSEQEARCKHFKNLTDNKIENWYFQVLHSNSIHMFSKFHHDSSCLFVLNVNINAVSYFITVLAISPAKMH